MSKIWPPDKDTLRKCGFISQSLIFPLFYNSINFLEKGVKSLTAQGHFSKIFLLEVTVSAWLIRGQFFDTDSNV